MTTARQWPVRCAELMQLIDPGYTRRDGYLPPGCCLSCHDDENECGIPMCSIDLPDGREAEICCATLRTYEEKGLR